MPTPGPRYGRSDDDHTAAPLGRPRDDRTGSAVADTQTANTVATTAEANRHINASADPQRAQECQALVAPMSRLTGCAPVMRLSGRACRPRAGSASRAASMGRVGRSITCS
jgi:hypothetical protein